MSDFEGDPVKSLEYINIIIYTGLGLTYTVNWALLACFCYDRIACRFQVLRNFAASSFVLSVAQYSYHHEADWHYFSLKLFGTAVF